MSGKVLVDVESLRNALLFRGYLQASNEAQAILEHITSSCTHRQLQYEGVDRVGTHHYSCSGCGVEYSHKDGEAAEFLIGAEILP